ncbi:hypothetical protein [Solibacillus daqui]|uniref:hypothetical protein n=1 Tax=Solibacillus daqui TaxID=2912187 RepID=UPI00236685D9|nr:hypothetical protein [Solibacillus daqui]
MTYYSRQNRMYMPGQQFGPPPFARQPFGYQMQNSFPPPRNSNYPIYPQNPYSYGQGQQPFSPYQQMPMQGPTERPDHLNTILGHMGTINNGLNMIKQFSSIMSIFRG